MNVSDFFLMCSESVTKRNKKFLCKYSACNNDICSVFVNNALDELLQLSGS